jgi:transcriptional regulator with XRE-family HTH domain
MLIMAAIRIRSVVDPFDTADPELIRAAVDTIALVEAMGLLPEGEDVERLDLPTVRRVARAIGDAGIGPTAVATLNGTKTLDRRRLLEAVEQLREALEHSPVPRPEWRALVELFGVERLAELTGVSAASLRRYASGRRNTPDDVAARLHFLAKVVGDLRGAYNEIGVRRWFERKRTALRGRSPAQILSGQWDPEAGRPLEVRALARSLVGSPAT